MNVQNAPTSGVSPSRPPIRDRFGIARLADKANASLEKHFWRWALGFTLIFFMASIVRDLRTALWFDELFTLHLARLASPREIIGFNDASPPLYPIIVHGLLRVVGNDALALRLPATLGYCAMLLCVWAFCRGRLPAAFAFAASLLTFERGLYFATEGRPYGLVLGLAGAALLCWQIAAEGRRRSLTLPLLAVCLALMVALHYYSIFFLAPLALAEIVRWRTSGKFDFGIWAALIPAVIVLGLHYALLVATQSFGADYWAKPSLGAIAPFYERFLLPPLILGALAVLVPALLSAWSSQPRAAPRATFSIHEWTALLTFVLLPPVVIVFSMYTTNVFFERYLLWTVIGFSVLGAAGLSLTVRGRPAVGLALIAVSIAAMVRLEIGPLFGPSSLPTAERVRQELNTLAQDGPEPIVVGNAHAFLELSYYLDSPLRERLIFPLSRELDLKYRGFDTDALTLGPLGQRASVRVEAYDGILAENRSFLLAAFEHDYLPRHLTTAGYRVTPLGDATTLYQVQAPDP
jgi:hypothetical protein